MLLPAITGLGVPVMVMPTTAEVTTGIVTVAEWAAGVTAGLSLLTAAVLTTWDPLAALGLTWRTTVKVAETPAARLASVPVIVPAPPTGGFVKVKAGPPVWDSETKVVLAGRLSAKTTFGAGAGPWFVTVIE